MKEIAEEKQQRINNLTSINGLATQMRAVYRVARKNIRDRNIDPQTAKTLVDILKIISTVHRDGELEDRVAALEDRRAK